MTGLVQERDLLGGVQRLYRFDNGYGASAVRHSFSYGGNAGLWELAVLDSNDKITYSTPLTDDVIGWLDDEALEEKLAEIAALPGEANGHPETST